MRFTLFALHKWHSHRLRERANVRKKWLAQLLWANCIFSVCYELIFNLSQSEGMYRFGRVNRLAAFYFGLFDGYKRLERMQSLFVTIVVSHSFLHTSSSCIRCKFQIDTDPNGCVWIFIVWIFQWNSWIVALLFEYSNLLLAIQQVSKSTSTLNEEREKKTRNNQIWVHTMAIRSSSDANEL